MTYYLSSYSIIALFTLILVSGTFSAQTTSNQVNPDWTLDGNWTGTAPNVLTNQSATVAYNSTITSPLVVNATHTLTIDSGDTLFTNEVITVKENGTLIVNGVIMGTGAGKEFKIQKGTLIINSGAGVYWAGLWTAVDAPSTITIDGYLKVDGNFTNSVTVTGSGLIHVLGTANNNVPGDLFNCTNVGSACCSGPPCGLGPGIPLPIDLLYFNANFNSILTRVDLAWETVTEINNDFFTIEKSENGKNWEIVSTVDGAGNDNQLVEYFDADYKPFKGISYYRLKQTDFDGEFSYSNTVPVNFITTDDKAMFSLFPSPVLKGQTLNIEINNANQLETLIVLRGARGQEFYSKTIINKDGNRILSIPIDNEIPAGIYLITATSNKQFYSKKLVIQ